MAEHHDLDLYSIPKEKEPLFINEPWLVDGSYRWIEDWKKEPETEPDNIRVYLPLDLNAEAIMRRLRCMIDHYGEANEHNESDFSYDVDRLINQIEIYDQIWQVRDGLVEADHDGRITGHSAKAVELVKRFVAELVKIPDGCAELFPFETVDGLCEEYGIECDRYWE